MNEVEVLQQFEMHCEWNTNTVKGNDNSYFRLYAAVPQPKHIQARRKGVGFLPRFSTETKRYVLLLRQDGALPLSPAKNQSNTTTLAYNQSNIKQPNRNQKKERKKASSFAANQNGEKKKKKNENGLRALAPPSRLRRASIGTEKR
ncbi:hypothetical protein LR48_Vigan2442s000100 [Vigna angularis]|nr:hypothetical protein LR48_Vigan2442s000100 [Vigna angularis]